MKTTTYTLTADDIVESKRKRLRTKTATAPSPKKHRNRFNELLGWACLILFVAGSLGVFVGGLHMGLNGEPIYLSMPLIVGLLWLWIAYTLVTMLGPAGAVRTFNKDEQNAGPFSIELTERGITHVTPTGAAEIEWIAIQSVWETANLLLILDDTPRFIVVPKRAFAASADVDEFKSKLAGSVAVSAPGIS